MSAVRRAPRAPLRFDRPQTRPRDRVARAHHRREQLGGRNRNRGQGWFWAGFPWANPSKVGPAMEAQHGSVVPSFAGSRRHFANARGRWIIRRVCRRLEEPHTPAGRRCKRAFAVVAFLEARVACASRRPPSPRLLSSLSSPDSGREGGDRAGERRWGRTRRPRSGASRSSAPPTSSGSPSPTKVCSTAIDSSLFSPRGG